jgi:hypothetical protein
MVQIEFDFHVVYRVFDGYTVFRRDRIFEVFAVAAGLSHGLVPRPIPYSEACMAAVLFCTPGVARSLEH